MVVDLLMKCPECGKEAHIKCGQVDRRDGLYWFRSWDCLSCGFKLEEDGEETPEELRAILKEKEGCWVLVVSEDKKSAEAFKVIKDVIGLSMKDIAKLRKDTIGRVYSGTQKETEHYFRRCRESGLELSVVKV
jgi:transposase-like protein